MAIAAIVQAPAAHAQVTTAQPAAANVERGETSQLGFASDLVIAAIAPLVDSDYVTAAPLLHRAKDIYEKLISEYRVEIKGESDIAKANSIGRAAYKAFNDEDWARSSFLYFYQAKSYNIPSDVSLFGPIADEGKRGPCIGMCPRVIVAICRSIISNFTHCRLKCFGP